MDTNEFDDNEPATLEFAEQVIGEASQAGLLSVRDGQLLWEGSITLTMTVKLSAIREVRMLAELLHKQGVNTGNAGKGESC